MADLVIRGGTIIDGLGGEPVEADIAIVDGKISVIGPNLPKGDEEIDATGKIVTPGMVVDQEGRPHPAHQRFGAAAHRRREPRRTRIRPNGRAIQYPPEP